MIVDRAQVAAVLPGYELGAQLGRGAFGLVLAARHRRLDRPVAIKIVAAGHLTTAAGFAAEARLLASLDHPHIARVHDYIEVGDLRLIVMELLDGGTLAARHREGMALETACAAGLAVAAALSYAHGHMVLHRDIKPGNLLFDAASRLKVTDFGIARIVEGSAATASAVGVGTPAYMAPEQILGGRLGPATDLYALGVVLYELLAGALPFDPSGGVQGLWRHHLATAPAPLAGVPAPLARVVLAALAKDPAGRPPSAHAFALDLARAAADAFGPRWITRSGIVLNLDDEVRDAAGDYPTSRPILTPPAAASALSTPSAPDLRSLPTPVDAVDRSASPARTVLPFPTPPRRSALPDLLTPRRRLRAWLASIRRRLTQPGAALEALDLTLPRAADAKTAATAIDESWSKLEHVLDGLLLRIGPPPPEGIARIDEPRGGQG